MIGILGNKRCEASRPRSSRKPHSESHFVVAPGVAAAADAEGIAFLHIKKARIFTSNRIGASVWEGLMRTEGIGTIAARISGEYGVPTGEVERDITGFVADLEAHGCIVDVTKS